jgi:hypothetical protein
MKGKGAVLVIALVAGGAVGVVGCHAAPRERPVRMGPTTGGLEVVRGQLKGTWNLVSFEAAGAEAPMAPVKAVGQLTYDDFGNFAINGRLLDPPAGMPAQSLTIKGRAVIDVPGSRMWIRPENSSTGIDEIPEGASSDRVRYFSFEGDQLILTVKDASGAVTAKTVWRRAQ